MFEFSKRNRRFGVIFMIISLSCTIVMWRRSESQVDYGIKGEETENVPSNAAYFVYRPPSASGINHSGLPFGVNTDSSLYSQQFVNLDTFNLKNFVFVTACSSNHFPESLNFIAGIQHHHPKNKIIYYDIGLNKMERNEIRSWCNVELRIFNFTKYPEHVKRIVFGGFKSIVVHETIQEFGAVFWGDSSTRLSKELVDWSNIFRTVLSTGGISLFTVAQHPIYPATNPGMYKYLPSDQDKLNHTRQAQSGAILMYKTKFVYENIMRWWYLCAMVEDCYLPAGHTKDCYGMYRTTYPKCHRYDQSALSILLSNAFAYNTSSYALEGNKVIYVNRTLRLEYPLKTCTIQK